MRSIKAIFSIYGENFSSQACEIYFNLVRVAHPSASNEEITKAFLAHSIDPERGRFAPKPADIVHQLNKKTQECAESIFYSYLQDQNNLIAGAVFREMGGMEKYTMCENSFERNSIKSDFLKIYTQKIKNINAHKQNTRLEGMAKITQKGHSVEI